jgi:hypothetical protein
MHINASYQNATYMNTLKCKVMLKHAADQKCIKIECNEILLNALKCMRMQQNAVSNKLHRFE